MDEGMFDSGRLLGVRFGLVVHPNLSCVDLLSSSDWTLHSTPKPAHPSYRLITSLRLYHILPLSAYTIPTNPEQLIDRRRDTTLGKQPCISAENEILWRKTLLEVCEGVLSKSQAGIEKIQRVADDDGKAQTWFEAAKKSIEMLWREEMRVAAAVIQSLEDNEEF